MSICQLPAKPLLAAITLARARTRGQSDGSRHFGSGDVMALKVTVTRKRKEKTVLVLQGGGALGAYQAGAYEAMAAAGHVPEWIAGMSIGAINGAIIAGNPPERRVARLREFWERVSSLLTATP